MVTGGGDYFPKSVHPWQGGLFLAAAVCITAFPMLAWIVYDSGLLNTRLGTMALACAAADDAFAWIMLATVVATAKGSVIGAVIALGGGAFYLVFMLTVGKRGLRRLDSWAKSHSPVDQLPAGPLIVTLLVVLIGAWFTDFVGIYAVFGAFIAGTVMPRGRLVEALKERLEPLTAYLLLPAFFIGPRADGADPAEHRAYRRCGQPDPLHHSCHHDDHYDLCRNAAAPVFRASGQTPRSGLRRTWRAARSGRVKGTGTGFCISHFTLPRRVSAG